MQMHDPDSRRNFWSVGVAGRRWSGPRCPSTNQRLQLQDLDQLICFIGRFGWLGDRVSLEDQVANAAFVEMNMTTSQGYKRSIPTRRTFPIRYNCPNCGPADKTVWIVSDSGNADLSEKDVRRMADYARWLGSPTRSEFQVSLPDVIAGEKIFTQIKCNTCHVISKIKNRHRSRRYDVDSRDFSSTVWRTRVAQTAHPFLSYIGTDLLMHDMGYLSQVGVTSKPNH